MKTFSINITDLKNYNCTLIEEYLELHPAVLYEVIIPWEQDENPDSLSCMLQYINAAYAGQLLSLCSLSFGYNVPSPCQCSPFRFEIEIPVANQLPQTLLTITEAYFSHEDAMVEFAVQAAQYYDDAFNGIIHSDTWGLLHMADKMLRDI